jgi:hypothetical protein
MVALNANFPLRDQGASNALGLDALPRHRWYFVKEGFSPKLVQQAISTDAVGKGEVLLDPFSGSGTVPLTAALCGLQARAFEINPFLRFLSATKLLQASARPLARSTDRILAAMKKPTHSPLEGFTTFTKGNRWKRWLFSTEVLQSFEAGRIALRDVNGTYRSLVKLALIGAAMDGCNATRDGKCLRYHKDWKKHEATVSDFRQHFEVRIKAIAADLEAAPLGVQSSLVIQGDARQLIGQGLKEKFRLCVTSPPYLNSFDYSDVYRPELFLGGFVQSTKSLMKIRLKTVRSHVQASWADPTKTDFGLLYQDCVTNLQDNVKNLWNPRIPKMVQAYFEDMETILRGLRRRALRKASVWLVVSTSAYGGVEVPVDLILAEIAHRSGWLLREVGVLRYLRSSSQHVRHVEDKKRKSVPLRESVVILDTSSKNVD